MQAETVLVGHGLQLFHIPVVDVDAVVGADGALGDGQLAVRDNQLGVNLQAVAQAGTDRAGAVRAVKAEGARFQLGNADFGMVRTGVHQAVGPSLLAVGIQDDDLAFGHFQGLLYRLHQPAAAVFVINQAVDYHLDAVALGFV